MANQEDGQMVKWWNDGMVECWQEMAIFDEFGWMRKNECHIHEIHHNLNRHITPVVIITW